MATHVLPWEHMNNDIRIQLQVVNKEIESLESLSEPKIEQVASLSYFRAYQKGMLFVMEKLSDILDEKNEQ